MKTKQCNKKQDETYIEKGDRLIEQGDFNGAIALYTEVISSDPEDGFNNQLRGEAYLKNGDYDRAIVDYSRAIALCGDEEERAMAHVYRAIAYKGKSEYHNVKADAEEAIKLGYYLPVAYLARGTAYFMLGPVKQGIEDWKTAADLGSKSALIELEKHSEKYKPRKK